MKNIYAVGHLDRVVHGMVAEEILVACDEGAGPLDEIVSTQNLITAVKRRNITAIRNVAQRNLQQGLNVAQTPVLVCENEMLSLVNFTLYVFTENVLNLPAHFFCWVSRVMKMVEAEGLVLVGMAMRSARSKTHQSFMYSENYDFSYGMEMLQSWLL